MRRPSLVTVASHLFMHEGRVYSPDGTVDIALVDVPEHNRAQDAAECALWALRPERFAPAYYHFPAQPEKLPHRYLSAFMPYTGAIVRTWAGSTLGAITHARVWRHNFGGRMVSMTIRGTNGAHYYGTASYDGGEVIRLRRRKA